MERALALYEPLFGPFSSMGFTVEGAIMEGGVAANCRLTLAFGRSGDLEIELIAVEEGDCPQRLFIEAGGNGMHHIRFRVEQLEAKMHEAESLGYRPIWYKRLGDSTAWCYLERPDDPLIIELLQMPEADHE